MDDTERTEVPDDEVHNRPLPDDEAKPTSPTPAERDAAERATKDPHRDAGYEAR